MMVKKSAGGQIVTVHNIKDELELGEHLIAMAKFTDIKLVAVIEMPEKK